MIYTMWLVKTVKMPGGCLRDEGHYGGNKKEHDV